MQRVQSLARLEFPPGTWTRTRWRLGINVLELTLCAWEMFLPKIVFFPQTSHSRAMASPFRAGDLEFQLLEMPQNPRGPGEGCQDAGRILLLSDFRPLY